MAQFTIDIDTGGTFTDGFFTQGDSYVTVKVDTTPHDLTVCFNHCIREGASRFGYEKVDAFKAIEIDKVFNDDRNELPY